MQDTQVRVYEEGMFLPPYASGCLFDSLSSLLFSSSSSLVGWLSELVVAVQQKQRARKEQCRGDKGTVVQTNRNTHTRATRDGERIQQHTHRYEVLCSACLCCHHC